MFVADSFQDVVGFSSANGTLKLEQPLGAEEEAEATEHEIRDPEYFHNALTCVVLGVVVMIILFFVCKFLNDLQVSPRSGRSRKGTGCGHQRLVESVPITLRGHSQVRMSQMIGSCLHCSESWEIGRTKCIGECGLLV